MAKAAKVKFDYQSSMASIAQRTSRLKVIRFFPNSDLRCSQDGLREVAKENGIDPWELAPGEFLVFANASQNRLKIYAPGNVLVFVKHPFNHRIDLNIVKYIPRFFSGTEFNYEAALRRMLSEKVEKKAA